MKSVSGVWALCVLATVSFGEARAEGELSDERLLSARPTLYVGTNDAEFGHFDPGLHVGLGGRSPEFGPQLRAEAELSVFLSLEGEKLSLADNSSWIRLSWRPEGWSPGEGLAFTLLPLHADRIFMGWEYPLATGLAGVSQSSVTSPSNPTTGAESSAGPGGLVRLLREQKPDGPERPAQPAGAELLGLRRRRL
ncbi:MAG: hypothetical protein QM765_00275 [Myxococcales bacterium]